MKTLHPIFLFTAMMFCLSSCGNDWLDTYPSNRIETTLAIATIDDARSAIHGVYFQIQRGEYGGGRMIWHGDVTGDDMRTHGNNITRSGATYRYEYNEVSVPSALWEQPYSVIRFANNILELIDNLDVPEGREAERNWIKGEALMARAMAHFDICRIYGYPYTKDNGASLGACIVTSPIVADSKPARSTVAECYSQVIIPDLKAAIPLLTDDRTASRGRFNRWAAKLLLSRVYLYMDDNENALREAEECITGAEAAGFALYTNSNYLEQWQTKFSMESLFEIVNITGQNSGASGIPFWCAANASNAYHELGITQPFYELLSDDPDDVRLSLLRVGVNYPDLYPAFILKYTNGGSDAQISNVTLFRLSEAYLNAAEAAVKLGNQNEKAVTYLHAITNRANPVNSVTGTVTLEMVLNERRKELFGEGHRSFDLLRNNMKIIRANTEHILLERFEIDRNDYFCVLPVPIQEIDANPNIIQNPGYGNLSR